MQKIRVASRVAHITYEIRDIVQKAKEVEKKGKKMIWLNIGDPNLFGFCPPQHITDAVIEALHQPKYSGYCPSEGDPELRQTIAKREGVNPQAVFITNGLSEGIDFLFQSLLNPGDNILLPSPGYPLYNTKSRVLGGTDNFYPCDENYLPIPDEIRKRVNKRTRAIVVINPNNPTGTVYPHSILKEIVNIAGENSLPIIADEIYDQLILNEQPMINLRSISHDVPLISGNGLSKNFIYPGARVGYLAFHGEGTEDLQTAIMKLCNQRLSVNWEMQRGALAAFTLPPTHLADVKKQLLLRRDALIRSISKIPALQCPTPNAAFYAFIKVKTKKFKNDKKFVYSLLEETGVVAIPGSGFSPILNDLYFRITFLPSPDIIEEAVSKIGQFIEKYA